jgi:SAM-dependent methyltransferase
MENREDWTNSIISRWDKSFKHRWIVFNETLRNLQNSSYTCLDIGCGKLSELSEDLDFKIKVGTDILFPQVNNTFNFPFLQSDLYYLPFRDQSIEIILLKFVVEHLEYPKKAFKEMNRILKPAGRILILTTNIRSPIIFLPKIIPYKMRKNIIHKIFGVDDDDIFPTYHHLNSLNTIKKLKKSFQIQKWFYIQDLNWSSKMMFYIYLIWHLITKWTNLKFLRSNFFALLKKISS